MNYKDNLSLGLIVECDTSYVIDFIRNIKLQCKFLPYSVKFILFVNESVSEQINSTEDLNSNVELVTLPNSLEYKDIFNNVSERQAIDYISIWQQNYSKCLDNLIKQIEFLEKNSDIQICGTTVTVNNTTNGEDDVINPVIIGELNLELLFCNPLHEETTIIRRKFLSDNKLTLKLKYEHAAFYQLWVDVIINNGKIKNLKELVTPVASFKTIKEDQKYNDVKLNFLNNIAKVDNKQAQFFLELTKGHLNYDLRPENALEFLINNQLLREPLEFSKQALSTFNYAYKSDINVCFHCDGNYAHYCYIAIKSILKNALTFDHHKFHVIYSGIDSETQKRFKKLVNHYNSEIYFHEADIQHFNSAITSFDYISKATYYRFLMGNVLKNFSLDRIISLDSDLIILGSLNRLWNQPFNGANVLACEDGWDFIHYSSHKDDLGLSDNSNYFNAGMAVYNLKKFNANEIFSTMETIKDKIKVCDQDVLNVYFKNQVGMLKPYWNCQESYFYHKYKTNVYDDVSLKQAKEKPYIVQFCGPNKPWSTAGFCTHPFRKVFFDYIDSSDTKLAKLKNMENSDFNNNTNKTSDIPSNLISFLSTKIKNYWGKLFQ